MTTVRLCPESAVASLLPWHVVMQNTCSSHRTRSGEHSDEGVESKSRVQPDATAPSFLLRDDGFGLSVVGSGLRAASRCG